MKITRVIDNETNTQKVWVQDEPGAPWREFDPAGELTSLRAEVERLKRENAALRCANARWETAVLACVDCANNREDEWGERAVASFAFLYAALDAARATQGGAS
jgi:hypothetical protein